MAAVIGPMESMKTTILSQIDRISFSLIYPLNKLSVFRNAGFSAIGIGLFCV